MFLAPHVHHRVVPKIIFGVLQMLQIIQGVSVCVVSAHVLAKCEPQPALLVVCSKGKSSEMEGTSVRTVSMPHWVGCLIQSLEQGLELSPRDGLEGSLHPFSIDCELSRCFLMLWGFTLVRNHPCWQLLGDLHCLLPCRI